MMHDGAGQDGAVPYCQIQFGQTGTNWIGNDVLPRRVPASPRVPICQ